MKEMVFMEEHVSKNYEEIDNFIAVLFKEAYESHNWHERHDYQKGLFNGLIAGLEWTVGHNTNFTRIREEMNMPPVEFM